MTIEERSEFQDATGNDALDCCICGKEGDV
jgi:hypothetical protein